MSGIKQFLITTKNYQSGNIKFGKIESAKSIPNARGARSAIGYGDMPDSYLTCIPKGSTTRRDPDTCLGIVFENMSCVGLLPQYPYTEPGQKPKPRIPENISGFNLMCPLVRNLEKPTEQEQHNLNMLKEFRKEAQKFILANKEKLPAAFRALDDNELKNCIQPIETPAITKDGKTYGPTLYGKVGYWPMAKAGSEKNKSDKDRPENFTTVFRHAKTREKYTAEQIKALVKTPGTATFILRVNHLNFLTGKGELEELKIKFDTELQEVVYVKSNRKESDLLGAYMTGGDEDDNNSDVLASFSKSIDPTVSYGDAPSKYGDDESDSSVEETKKKESGKKKKNDEEPVKKKKVVEDEPTVTKKKKKNVEE